MVENLVTEDMESGIRDLLLKHKILEGGKIFIFERDTAKDKTPESGRIVENIINRTAPELEVVRISEQELNARKAPENEYEEIKALTEIVSSGTDGTSENILAVIRGRLAEDIEQKELKKIAKFSRKRQVPVVIVGGYEPGRYSFIQAIMRAIKAKEGGDDDSWFIRLRPAEILTKEALEEYRLSNIVNKYL